MKKARRSLTLALKWFEQRGHFAELPRVRRNIAMMYRDEGNYPEAVTILFEVRAEFIRLEMPIVAALAGIEIVEIQSAIGRLDEIEFLCGEMVKTLADADLPREALRALAYLHEIAAMRSQNMSGDIDHMRAFLDRFQGSSGMIFTAPQGATEVN